MNTDKENKIAFVTITYDIVDGHPPGWDHLVSNHSTEGASAYR
jgi:hypothetical protein